MPIYYQQILALCEKGQHNTQHSEAAVQHRRLVWHLQGKISNDRRVQPFRAQLNSTVLHQVRDGGGMIGHENMAS